MAAPNRAALAFLGSGLGGSSVNAAESTPRQPVSLQYALASLQGPSEPCATLPTYDAADRGLARPGSP